MRIDRDLAARLIRDAASQSPVAPASDAWRQKIEEMSRLCVAGGSKTHIAFLGAVILAKSTDSRADLFAIKPTHAKDNPYAFSARSLCHKVLVPLSAELGFSIGVAGREPLNNQPYFRMTRLDDDTPVRPSSREAFDYMLGLVHELNGIKDERLAREALRAFVEVRKLYQLSYTESAGSSKITPDLLADAIHEFVLEDSESGRRAQAVAAGLMDLFAGPNRVESGRINDPSRNYPGDICLSDSENSARWERAIEVRDKPVQLSDVQIFGRKCIERGVQEAAVLMTSEKQTLLDSDSLTEWANRFELGLTLFYGWNSFVEQTLYWSSPPKPLGAVQALEHIRKRLIQVEVRPASLDTWDTVIKKHSETSLQQTSQI